MLSSHFAQKSLRPEPLRLEPRPVHELVFGRSGQHLGEVAQAEVVQGEVVLGRSEFSTHSDQTISGEVYYRHHVYIV